MGKKPPAPLEVEGFPAYTVKEGSVTVTTAPDNTNQLLVYNNQETGTIRSRSPEY